MVHGADRFWLNGAEQVKNYKDIILVKIDTKKYCAD